MRSLIRRRYSKWLVKIPTIVIKKELKLNITSSRLGQNIKTLAIRYFRNEKATGAEMRRAIVSGIVTGDAPVSYWPIFFRVPSNGLSSVPSRCLSVAFCVKMSLTKLKDDVTFRNYMYSGRWSFAEMNLRAINK